MKAKRSLTSSFDQLLKRKGSQMDIQANNSQPKVIDFQNARLFLPHRLSISHILILQELIKRSNSSQLEDGNDGNKSSGSENGKETTAKRQFSPSEIEQLKNHFQKENRYSFPLPVNSSSPGAKPIAFETGGYSMVHEGK